MKKNATILVLVLLSLSLSAAVGGGYSFSPVGESFSSESFGGVQVGGFFSPSGIRNIGRIDAEAVFAINTPIFRGFNIMLSSPLWQTSRHIFNRAFSNPVLWQPSLGAGIQYRRGGEWRFMAILSPFSFQSASFSYNILSPYLIADMSGRIGWGMTLFKISATFGGLN